MPKLNRINALAAFWGLAEATVFYIVPDVLLSWVALRSFKRAMWACLWALLGALAGGAIIWFVGSVNPEPLRSMFVSIPAIGDAMLEQTRAHRRGRPIGWLAYNTARIEADLPIYHIDFGPDTLPNETGPALLGEMVSFTKGCYVGQEIVARLQNLGHPKRLLVGLKFADDRMPIAGSQVLGGDTDDGDVVGAVTSSTISPLRGNVAVALAMVQWASHEPGTELRVPAEGQIIRATVQPLAEA